MAVKACGFQHAVDNLASIGLVAQAAKPQIKQLQVVPELMPAENKPLKGSYEKFAVLCPGLPPAASRKTR